MNGCYANPLPTFQPAMRIIQAITNSNPAEVTTTFAHQYLTGTIVRLDLPPQVGMQQANQQFGPIVVTSPTTFTIALDTTFFDPFVVPVGPPPGTTGFTCAQVIPIGEVNETLLAATQNVLPY